MAHLHDRQSSVARPLRTRFEPSHLAQAGLEEAYARVVPLGRRARLPLLPPGSWDAGAVFSGDAAFLRQHPQEEAPRCS